MQSTSVLRNFALCGLGLRDGILSSGDVFNIAVHPLLALLNL